ncbi:MBL fold metallo-hydrolase [Rhodobacteraceae bacterium XHP0102]|nr:MBL fold metallo-hydrolase [Rhodobacteraceae bacterium XHP0102]
MQITRRNLILSTAAAAVSGLALPRRSWAQTTVQMGDFEVMTLSDGTLTLPADFIFGPMDQAALAPILAEAGVDRSAPLTPPCNVTLLRKGDATLLIDTGAGFAFQDSAGQLLDALDAAGIAPDDITHVLFTHGHPDHLWGVLDDFDEATFLNAEHIMGETEYDYWMDPATINSIGEARASFAAGAARRLETLGDQVTRIADGAEIISGLRAQLTPGHTPGHLTFALGDGAEQMMIIGDVVTNDHVGFARPDWITGSDQDAALGASTRARLMDQCATDNITIIGYHLPNGGIGKVTRAGDGYRFAAL